MQISNLEDIKSKIFESLSNTGSEQQLWDIKTETSSKGIDSEIISSLLFNEYEKADTRQKIILSDYIIQLRGEKDIDFLNNKLQSEVSPEVKGHIAWLLSNKGSKSSSKALLNILLQDEDEDIRSIALSGLDLSDTLTISIIKYICLHDDSLIIQSQCRSIIVSENL